MNEFILTSESVTMNHLDKISNIISNSILDAYLTKDSTTRLEAETAVKKQRRHPCGQGIFQVTD